MGLLHISRKIIRNLVWSGMFLSFMAPVAEASLQNSLSTGEPALSEEKLEQLRGGFLTSSGFLVKFSFENLVQIDGTLLADTVIVIPELQVPTFKFVAETAPSVSTLADREKKPIASDFDLPIENLQPVPGAANTLVSSNGLTTVSQSGLLNRIAPENLKNLDAVQTFIQNTLNDKRIQHSQLLTIEISKYPFQRHGELSSRINAQMLELR